MTFDGTALQDGETYTVEEIIVKNNYLPHYLETVDKNGTKEDVGIDLSLIHILGSCKCNSL